MSFSGRGNSDSLCQLRDFAINKCSGSSDSCKRCVIDTVERSCPYYADRGPPNCPQLQACAKGISFNC